MSAETPLTSVTEPRRNLERPPRRRLPVVIAALFLCATAGLFYRIANVAPLDGARKAAATGDVAQAVRLFEQHLRAQPEDWTTRLEYGAFLKQHDAGSALLVLEHIPRTAPEYIPAARHIAQISLVGNRDALAELTLKNLYADNPNDFEVVRGLALLYSRQDKNAEAIPFAVKCTELKPDTIEPYLLLSQIYFNVGRSTEMAEPLRKVLKLDPENREAHLNLAYSLLKRSEFEAARQEAEWSRKHDPGNVQVWRVLAEIERDDAHDEAALKYVRQGLRIDPNELECRILEGQILASQKKFQEAYERMLPVYQRLPRERRVVGVLVQATRAMGRNEEAAKLQKLLVELGNENYRGGKKSGM